MDEPNYAAFARHGHEWDPWNIDMERPLAQDTFQTIPDETYLRVPIGEVIAAELASKFAPCVKKQLLRSGSDRNRARYISDQFKTVDDVRPLSAIIPWRVDVSRVTIDWS